MRGIRLRVALGAALAVATLGTAPPADGPAPRVVPNDNRAPAGVLRDGVLSLDLEVRLGEWFPEADDGASLTAPFLAEVGRPPQVPAPLIRVPVGTTLEITVHNTLTDSAVILHGLFARPAASGDSLLVPPGERRSVRFTTGAPGTYMYGAWAGRDTTGEREQMTGAFVIDSVGVRTDDRIFVMNIWGEALGDTAYRNAVAINGKSFPFTEPITLTVGDSVRWRWVNGTGRNHPMHLHGSYYRIDSKGTLLADTVYGAAARRTAVTEDIRPSETMSITWSPAEPGNWLFHCHIAFHAIPEAARFDYSFHGAHVAAHMAGLVLAIQVQPPMGWQAPPRAAPRRVRFVIEELPRHGDSIRTVGVGIADGSVTPRPVSPGPMLVVTQGQPTDMVVVNRLAETTAIHWHGLELESWSDGVAGWSGIGSRVAPPVAASDSFTAHLTLRRAGTFIYHTHLHDVSQLTAGLFGPIVVLPPGKTFDPATDLVFTAGWDGPSGGDVIVNGDTTAPPLTLARGRPYRLRFVNIGPAGRLRFSVERDSADYLPWRRIAKDGADLPVSQAIDGPATEIIEVGETLDVSFTADAGDYELTVRPPNGRRLFFHQAVVVR